MSERSIGRLDSWSVRLGLTKGATAAIATMIAVGAATGLMSPLVSLTLASRGVSERTIGMVVATYAIAMLVAAPWTAWITARLGTGQTLAFLTIAAACLIPLVWYIETVALLFPVLFAFGVCIALCFTLSEYWITAVTPMARRGVVIGLYASMLSIGFAIGPAIIATLGADTVVTFFAGSLILVLAALPALVARTASPHFEQHPRTRFAAFIFAAPAATLGALVFAAGESGGFAFLPLWGQHLGYSASVAALLVSAMTLGNVASQIPLGILSDRMDRRLILLALGLVGAAGMPLAWAVSDSLTAVIIVLFVWGGATAGLYTVGLAHLAARFPPSDLAGANSAFVFCYGFGMLVGPMAIGDAMARAPIAGLPIVLAVAFAAYTILVIGRMAFGRT